MLFEVILHQRSIAMNTNRFESDSSWEDYDESGDESWDEATGAAAEPDEVAEVAEVAEPAEPAEIADDGSGDVSSGACVDWEVGRGRPPIEYRFRKGKSGNPGGRPRKDGSPGNRLRGADEPTQRMILDEAYAMVTVRQGDSEIEMPMNQAVFRAVGMAALKGSEPAQRRWADMVLAAETAAKRAQIALYNANERAQRERQAKHRDYHGDEGYDPYAEEIIVDSRSGQVVVRGDG
jgi:hypothetical protein